MLAVLRYSLPLLWEVTDFAGSSDESEVFYMSARSPDPPLPDQKARRRDK